jgi:hypothetical protein
LGGFGDWNCVTVEAWVYLTENNYGSIIVGKIPSYALGFSTDSTNMVFAAVWPYTGEVADDDNQASVDYMRTVNAPYGSSLQLNQWYHIAFTYENGVGLKLYINGALVASTDLSSSGGPLSPSRGEPVYIGKLVEPFKGMIDEVKISNCTQSLQQINNSYSETKDGASNKSSFVPLGIATSGDQLGCDVIPTDSYIEGTTQSNSIIIQNTQPTATNVALYPIRDRPYRLDNENLQAGYVYYDADNSPESGTEIRWYRNGELQTGLNDLLEVPASDTSVGQTWYFTVRPRDGTSFGDLQTSQTVTIRSNTAPSTGVPSLDSMNGGTDYDDDDLVGAATSTTDTDGDLTTNIYHWFKNGVSTTNLQLPFDTEIPQLQASNGVAIDYSGYGNNGSVYGSTWVQNGVVGGAMSFDGNDYITVQEQNDTLGGSGNWSQVSVEFWIKASGETTSTQTVILKPDTWYYPGAYFYGTGYRVQYSGDTESYAV